MQTELRSGKRMFVPTDASDVYAYQDAHLGGVLSPDGTDGTEGTGTKDDNDKEATSITSITDVKKDEEVRCNICLAYIGDRKKGEDVLQCQVCQAWVCNDCIEIDGNELNESKFRCEKCTDYTTPEPDIPEPKKPRKTISERSSRFLRCFRTKIFLWKRRGRPSRICVRNAEGRMLFMFRLV